MDNTSEKTKPVPRSYFVRHTRGVLVREFDLEQLWKQNRIAIHFPGDTSVKERDSESLEPADYKTPNERGAIRAFAEFAEHGGYVWAQSYVSDDIKVGCVRGSREGGGESMEKARWELRGRKVPGREDGHPATLKTLQMEGVTELRRDKAMHLRAARPRSVALCRWGIVGSRLRDLVNRENPEPEWSSLSVAEQEAACAEFLRERHAGRPELPVLSRLLLPVGRTLEDVDIYGLTIEGSPLYAQVTHHSADSQAAKKKAARLSEYSGAMVDDAILVSFCKGPAPAAKSDASGVTFVSVDEEIMPWILADYHYRDSLFGEAWDAG